MSKAIPKALFSRSHSSFALIDPSTEKFHRRFDRHAGLTSGLRRHVTISYVWSEWKDDPSDRLPNWAAVRERLLSVVGNAAPRGLRAETWSVSSCWIDCKCIDQDSDADKAYWIPRMYEVYSEARCTVLLLRNDNLTSLMKVAQEMSCQFKGKLNSIGELLSPHNCLLSQSCTTLPELTPEREHRCLDTLRSFASGLWRRRAWILQEILLSENYLLSWGSAGWMSLADLGVIAGVLFHRHPVHAWLGDFANWCRRLWYLRQNYGNFDLSDANVLQLSADLEATVPADRFYALCSILRLKETRYDAKHSADEALQIVLSELVRNGRMSWLYAIRPPLGGPEIELRGDHLAPFVLTRLGSRLMANRQKMEITTGVIGLTAKQIGIVVWVLPLGAFLNQAITLFNEQTGLDPPPELSHLVYTPLIIRRLALDIVDPLWTNAIFDAICETLGIRKEMGSSGQKASAMVMYLFALNRDPTQQELGLNEDAAPAARIAAAAAWSIQNRISQVLSSFSVIKFDMGTPEDLREDSRHRSQEIALGCPEASVGASVYSVKGDQELLFAIESDGESDAGPRHSVFQGMLLQLQVNETIGPVPSKLLTTKRWKTRSKDGRTKYLTFPYNSASVN